MAKKKSQSKLGAVFADPNMLLFQITLELNIAISALTNAKNSFNKYVDIVTKKETK